MLCRYWAFLHPFLLISFYTLLFLSFTPNLMEDICGLLPPRNLAPFTTKIMPKNFSSPTLSIFQISFSWVNLTLRVPDWIKPITTFPLTGLPNWFRIRANGSQPRASDQLFGKFSLLCWTPDYLTTKKGDVRMNLHRGEMLKDGEGPGGVIQVPATRSN